MKNIFKLMIPCLAVAFSLASCNDTMDDKSVIDAKYEKASSASVTLTNAEAVDFQSISAAGSVANHTETIEEGVQISTSADFAPANVISVANDTVDASFEVAKAGLAEQTTYYVRAYAVTKTAGIIVSESKTVTTPKAPIFPLDGTYIATEWDLNDDDEWENAGQYEIEVSFDAEDPTIVNITNLWDGGMTIQGQYDEAKGTITVPNYQVIYVHANYGDVWIRGVNSAVTAYTSAVTFTFTALGGKMESTPMGAICSAGSFGYFYVTMEHQ